ncbi:hypothetical protein ROLI_044540 [Roseobacter fucihabitans]|uniref:asparagine synthase (glutamine-hydrolyzing) n=1 Tax=Roseobacter fucihabitans TaxID=1537242 RepID=A0ABZ2C1C9_9RHOB|nr:asparagine synthase-related protein [Roseobacter litoralis]MBC6963933.1 Asparagine synthetase (glutamine-hydrolyzing) 1 [Roseobacter litoralis]MBC6963982.1 Asparagine synthetase (glutamine-hydrolyzing) 1 [Roseobacter litoralis]
MTHAFAVRIPLAGATPPPIVPARLIRMADHRWDVRTPRPGVDVAICGAAETCQSADWSAVGLVFLEDRGAVETRLGLTHGSTQSDLQLLLELRLADGPEFAVAVAGSFSVVFIDLKTGAFEAYRDQIGLYPLYYSVQNGALSCASDLRACMHLAGMDLDPCPLRIADFIQGEEIDLAQTAFDALLRLPPAHALRPTSTGVAVDRYWQMDIPHAYGGTNAPGDLRAALSEATAACLRPDVKSGAMLSGGLDSSALAGLAAERMPDFQTLSFVYGSDKTYDETPYIDVANAAFKTLPHKIPITAGTPLETLGSVVTEQMDLFLAPGLPKSRQIYTEARGLNIDVLIDGHGGDEAISHGYGRLVELAAARRFASLFREARGAAQVHGVPLLALVASNIARYGGLRPRHPLRRVLMKIARLLSQHRLVSNWSGSVTALIAPDLRKQVNAETRYRPDPVLKTKADFQNAATITHLKSLTDPLIIHSFEVLHRSATAAGVLPRYPFLNRRVLALCLSFPADMKLRDGRSRWALREAMQGLLPDKIRLRADKAEFGKELGDTVLAFYRDKDASVFASLADFVDIAQAEQLRAQVIAGDITDVAAIRALWRLAVLLHWVAAFEHWRDAQTKGVLI